MSEDPSYGFPVVSDRKPTAGSPSPYGPPSELAVSPDDLKLSVSKAFDAGSAELAGALLKEIDELIAVGDFWGGDEAGMTFANGESGVPGYAATVEAVMTEASAIPSFYTGVADRVFTMGKNVEDANWASIAEMPRILQ